MNKPPYIVTERSISVIWDGKPYTVLVDHPNYAPLYKAILNAEWDKVGKFLSLEKNIEDFSSGEISVKNGKVFYAEKELHGVVVEKLLQFLRQGSKDSQHLLNFINRLIANSSSNSVEQLYTFLGYKNLPVTENGYVIGYRGVQEDWYSKSGNKDTIVIQGTVNENGQIYNGVGEVIEVKRNCVDDNKENHCSHGLHVGSYDYAKSWAGQNGRVIMVEFDPADAVSVPTDCSFQKLRVCKYRVLAEVPKEKLEKNDAPLNKASYYVSDITSNGIDENDDDCEDDCDCSSGSGELNAVKLAIKKYVSDRCGDDNPPTLKNIQSRLKNYSLTCKEIKDICLDLGFNIEESQIIPLSSSLVWLPV